MKIEPHLRFMAQKNASDLFLTAGAVPSIKIEGEVYPVSEKCLGAGVVGQLANELMNEAQKQEFARQLEMNVGLSLEGIGRFRVNIYRQRGEVSIVIRFINMHVESLEDLGLPPVLKDFSMLKNGLVLIVGATGSGKSTTLASMVEARNEEKSGHILTIEDPIEYAFRHKKSIVSQREVGIDTLSYQNALRESLREAPDVIVIGEIRDQESMEAAISLADTGHLVIATLHAVNANQALDRIINFFPVSYHHKLLHDLAHNIKAIVSQRLVKGVERRRVAAAEVMINTPYISELIAKGKVSEIKESMEKDSTGGMQSFDQSLIDLFERGLISQQEALDNADSQNNIKWKLNFGAALPSENPAIPVDNELESKDSEPDRSAEFELEFQPSQSAK